MMGNETKRIAHTVFISDIHLGTEVCNHVQLLKFLKSFENIDGSKYNLTNLYLVGDIIDIVQMNHKIFWTKHRIVIKKLLRMADKGVNIIYIPGNHDYHIREEIIKSDYNMDFNGICIKRNDIYTSLSGKKFLVLHGDEFDGVVRCYPIIYVLGDFAYNIMIFINCIQNKIRRFFKLKEWSFSLWIKTKVKKALQFINNYEMLIVSEAKKYDVDGVICGHIHKAEDIMIDDVRYLNDGCFTEFCSTVIEYPNGEIKLEYINE